MSAIYETGTVHVRQPHVLATSRCEPSAIASQAAASSSDTSSVWSGLTFIDPTLAMTLVNQGSASSRRRTPDHTAIVMRYAQCACLLIAAACRDPHASSRQKRLGPMHVSPCAARDLVATLGQSRSDRTREETPYAGYGRHVGSLPRFRLSGREDLNLRPHGPEPCALPDCATPR